MTAVSPIPMAAPSIEFPLADLHAHIRRFAFIAGYEPQRIKPEDPANLKAATLLANLHDRLHDVGYAGHDLQRFMVRILFCLFAEDTGIFDPLGFENFIRNQTNDDGRDVGPQLESLFETLNTPNDDRPSNLDDELKAFPYVNGRLYAERLRLARFDGPMRQALLECCGFKWETISPVIFGSIFQGIMDDRARRQIGAHYTSERDILKLVKSLLLDKLAARLHRCARPADYDAFLRHLGGLKLLDPACGCGNFLVLAYRELRRLEMDAIAKRFGDEPDEGDVRAAARLNVGQFYGIEIEEWPALIAEVGMWLMDHQMNNELFARFGAATATVPLRTTATIKHANALQLDWNAVLPAAECSYVLGNPPFVGGKYQDARQKADMAAVWGNVKGAGLLDYVTCWHLKATEYTRGTAARAALVSTNSITQGEQVGVLWPELFRRGVKIDFGHRTFPWESEARGKAHVHVVIVGFGHGEPDTAKIVHDYGPKGVPLGSVEVANVSPYLTDGSDRAVTNRSRPLCDVPSIGIGNKPIDDGNYLFTPEEKAAFVAAEPASEPYFRRWFGSQEFLNGIERWCLWLGDVPPNELRRMPKALERVEAVRKVRSESISAGTRNIAATPTRFHVENMPDGNFLVIPGVSSERRPYIPIGFMPPEVMASNLVLIVPDATPYHFGVLHSAMHMAWVREVCGRLKSDYRYSAKLVYNNFPWPTDADAARRGKVEAAAGAVLAARENHPGATLADLYDPLAMPADLARAHAALDRAVDLCYRPQPFPDERRRFEHLFALYERLVAPLTAPGKAPRRRIVDP